MSPSELAHLETLAALDDPNASDEERARRSHDLASIIDHVRTLEHALAGEDVTELDVPQALRPDVPRAGLSREDALRSAPHADETSFMVPRIVP